MQLGGFMTTLNKIGFWGWLVLITIALVFRVKSCGMDMDTQYTTYMEFWWLYMILTPVLVYMWFRDWSRSGMFDFRKF
jgi:hypothetical protein